MKLTLIPRALDIVWRFYATHDSGLEATGLPIRGTDRLTGITLEQRVALEATA